MTPEPIKSLDGLVAPGDQNLLRFRDDALGMGFYQVQGSLPRWDFHFKKLNASEVYLDKKSVIPPQFEDASEFADGVAAIQIEGKWGLIDSSGKVIVPPTFDFIGEQPANFDAQAFRQGLAPARKGTDWGYIRTDGTWAIAPSFASATKFNEDLAWVRYTGQSTWSLIDTKGQLVAHTKFEAVLPFFEGLAAVLPQNQGWGFCGRDGKIAINYSRLNPFKTNGFEAAQAFSEGHALVQIETNVYTYIDTAGKQPFEAHYTEAQGFYNGRAAVKIGAAWAYIDKTGKVVIAPKYEQADCFLANAQGQITARIIVNSQTAYIDLDGNIIPGK